MFKRFREDPNYLTKYHLTVAAILLCFNCSLFLFHPPTAQVLLWYLPAVLLMTSTELKHVMIAVVYACAIGIFQFEYSLWNIFSIIPAIVLTFPFTSWIHSPSHGSIRPRWLNRPLGELMGLVQLTGFPDWTVIHVFHHQHSDHPELDPHAPLQKSYWKFAFGMRTQVAQCIIKHYFHYFGQNETSIRRLKYFMVASRLNMFMKVSFWYLVLGPQYFTFLFLPSILFKMLHYSWFNYATHRPGADGKYEIKNLNQIFYRLINFIGSGLYFHGNHHTNPSIHNPMKMQSKEKVTSDAA